MRARAETVEGSRLQRGGGLLQIAWHSSQILSPSDADKGFTTENKSYSLKHREILSAFLSLYIVFGKKIFLSTSHLIIMAGVNK